MKRIRTILYGDQPISPGELEILHTPSLQRLYGLRQLGLTDRVFVDASHSRLHHVVGVLAQVDRIVNAIVKNLAKPGEDFQVGTPVGLTNLARRDLVREVRRKRPVIRLIGLLHDLTHAPFGHTVEDEINVVESKHDEPDRQADAFYRLVCQLCAWLAADIGWANDGGPNALPTALRPFLEGGFDQEIPPPAAVASVITNLLTAVPKPEAAACWRLRVPELATLFGQLDAAMTALLHLELLHARMVSEREMPADEPYPFQTALRSGLAATPFAAGLDSWQFLPRRDAYMLDVVGNTVCADLLDYARRDSHFTALSLAYDADRVTENFTLVCWDPDTYEPDAGAGKRQVPPGRDDPFSGLSIRTAISLVSHKYRPDVPGEMMNLLNTRFHLYERAIYHPTKCAAGAMLGTALQMIGWRRRAPGQDRPGLTARARALGDDLFLSDVRAAVSLVLAVLRNEDDDSLITKSFLDDVKHLREVHSGLAFDVLSTQVGLMVAEVKKELAAAGSLLDRLRARRFSRPIFRILPSSENSLLGLGAETVAKTFRDPDTRYGVERQIEARAHLPLGTVSIHCPRRQTAAKVANVLLFRPRSNAPTDGHKIFKLRHIGRLDQDLFGKHEEAVRAVEEMYKSMWRLVVCVTPEHLSRHKAVVAAAGREIFAALDVYGRYAADDPNAVWQNDDRMEAELEVLSARTDDSGLNAGRVLLGEVLGDLVGSGQLEELDAIAGQAAAGGFGASEVRDAVKALLRPSLSSVGKIGIRPFSRLEEVAYSYFDRRPKTKSQQDFRQRYEPVWSSLTSGAQEALLSDLKTRIVGTPKSLEFNKGTKLNELSEVLDDLFVAAGASLPPRPPREP